jgi:hypothetical protein
LGHLDGPADYRQRRSPHRLRRITPGVRQSVGSGRGESAAAIIS